MSILNEIPSTDMFFMLRKSIKGLIEKDPKATAQDVLDMIVITSEVMEVFTKNLSKEKK